MLKKEKRRLLSMCLVTASLFLCSCGGGAESETAGGDSRTSFTEEELESGHASFQIEENLVVDADITKKEAWDGKKYAAYYPKVFCETDEGDSIEKFRKSPTLFRHGPEEWQEALAELEPGKFKKAEFALKDGDIIQKYKGDNDRTYQFIGNFGGMQKGLPYDSPFYCAYVRLTTSGASGGYSEVMEAVPGYRYNNDLSFLEDPDEQAEKIRAFLEDMSGRRINGDYDFVPIGKENREKAESKGLKIDSGEDRALFMFYYDIGGLPFYHISLEYEPDSSRKLDDLCYWASMGNTHIESVSEWPQMVMVDGNGIVWVELTDFREPGDVCREAAGVMEPDEVLAKVEEHYGKQILTTPHTISDIDLAYIGYFWDDGDTVRPDIQPVWDVAVYVETGNGQMLKENFIYDACTGDTLNEGVGVYG